VTKINASAFKCVVSSRGFFGNSYRADSVFITFILLVAMTAALPVLASPPPGDKGQLSSLDRSTIELMAKDSAEAVRKNYFDPAYGGVDFNAAYKAALQDIARAGSVHEGYDAIANMMAKLNDSHTRFYPPEQPFIVEQGWDMQFIGDKFVTFVKRGSDAEGQGLKPGDEVLELENVRPTRANWVDLRYRIKDLAPRSSLHVVVASPGHQATLKVIPSVVKQRAGQFDITSNEYWIYRHQFDSDMEKYTSHTLTLNDVLLIKLATFMHKDEALDGELHKAEKARAVIVDLRGNPGGAESFLLHLLGNLFDRDVTVGEHVGRTKSKPLIAKARHVYSGKVIVLVDSDSASCSEIMARAIQLEKRGTVIGDKTAAAVRTAIVKEFEHGQGTVYFYAAEVTINDLKMSDGNSLEKIGVTPDELLLPTPQQLAAGEDPQLARAFELAGAPISAQKAGKLFPRREQ
jgi:carboxyl-terminal processing protease